MASLLPHPFKEGRAMREHLKAWTGRRRARRADSLPDYGRLYFEHLNGEYRSLPAAKMDPDLKGLVESLQEKKQQATLTWDDLYTFELMLARLTPVEKLPRKVWSLRSRYRDVAGLREYEAYLASKPPDPEGKVEEEILRGDIEYLLGQLYLRYAIMPLREQERTMLSWRVTRWTLTGLVILLIFISVVVRGDSGKDPSIKLGSKEIPIRATTLTVVLFVGAMGGLISMQQRFQSASNEGDLIENVSKLRQGSASIRLSPVSGAVFAAIMYLIIAAGLVEGGLFPHMKSLGADPKGTGEGVDLLKFILAMAPETYTDFAKLMVWSFLAGFAERLVPDTLSRFVEQGTAESGAKA
jgi:hypothetical protein